MRKQAKKPAPSGPLTVVVPVECGRITVFDMISATVELSRCYLPDGRTILDEMAGLREVIEQLRTATNNGDTRLVGLLAYAIAEAFWTWQSYCESGFIGEQEKKDQQARADANRNASMRADVQRIDASLYDQGLTKRAARHAAIAEMLPAVKKASIARYMLTRVQHRTRRNSAHP